MKRGQTVTIKRRAKTGPAKPTDDWLIQTGTLVKCNGSSLLVQFGEERTWVKRWHVHTEAQVD